LLSWYSREFKNSPGFFDYIDAHRLHAKKDLSTWDASSLNDSRIKQSLGAQGQNKFAFTKEYLASLVFGDLRELQASLRENEDGAVVRRDSIQPIRDFFNSFFSPMKFIDVQIDCSPFRYIVQTPRGDIDIDDLSAGEKEVLNTFIHFHQLQPKNAVILFDEADAHLHPDLERRYLEVLRDVGSDNQIWLTTHSPEMMIEAGSEALFTVLKEPPGGDGNQFVQVSSNQQLHSSLTELMGSRGLVSFNQRIVFIEGTEASADRFIYEKLYPPGQHNISFVPVGDSGAVRSIAERVNSLLEASVGFQHYYSIVDGDLNRAVQEPGNGRLFKLPVYHVENFLLDEGILFEAVQIMLADKCPYQDSQSLVNDLHVLLTEETHLSSFARALLDSRIAALAKSAHDAVYQNKEWSLASTPKPEYDKVKEDAKQIMLDSIKNGDWRDKCKGRELLKAFCGKHGIKYEHFRNVVVGNLTAPPERLDAIMKQIVGG